MASSMSAQSLNVFSHGSDLVHGGSEGNDTVAADAAVGRFEAHDPTKGGRLTDRTASVGAQGDDALIGSHGRS